MFICSVVWWGAFFLRWWQSVVAMLGFLCCWHSWTGGQKAWASLHTHPSKCLYGFVFDHSFLSCWLTEGHVFCFTKLCRLLQGQWMKCSLEIPNLEEQGEEMKDFEDKRTAPWKAAAGYQAGSKMVYVHCLLKWSTSSSLFKKKGRGGGGICVGRDQEGMVILPH